MTRRRQTHGPALNGAFGRARFMQDPCVTQRAEFARFLPNYRDLGNPAQTSSRSNGFAFPPFCPQDSEILKHLLQCALGIARLMSVVREHLNVNTLLLDPQLKSTDEQVYVAHGILDELIQ
jgi:hypothetical protein